MIADTDYRHGGDCTDLCNYINKGDGLRNRQGEKMAESEEFAFVEASKREEMERMIVLSPHPDAGNQMTDDDLSFHTRQTMAEYLDDKPDATYCFAVHRDTDIPHTQVAMTGSRDSVEMYEKRREELDEIATEMFNEQQYIEQAEQAQTDQEGESRAQSHTQAIGGD